MRLWQKSAAKGMRLRLIMVVLAIVLIGVIGFVNISFTYYQSNMKRTASELINSNLRQIGDQIENVYLDMMRLSNIISRDETLWDLIHPEVLGEGVEEPFHVREYAQYSMNDYFRLARIEDQLNFYQSNYLFNYSSHIVLITVDGLAGICIPLEEEMEDRTVRDYCQNAKFASWCEDFLKENDRNLWIVPFSYLEEAGTGARYITLATKMQSSYRVETEAILMISINIEELDNVFQNFPAETYLFDTNNHVIYSHSKDSAKIQSLDSYQEVMENVKENIVHTYTFQRFGLKMVAVIPSYNDLILEMQTFKKTFIVISVLIFGCVAIFMTLVVLRVTQPLMSMMNRLKTGAYGIFSLKNTSQDEFKDVIAGFENMFQNINELHERMLQEQKTEFQLKYDMLKAQINPHFLFNTLNIIKWTALMDGNQKVSEMLTDLGSLLEASINRESEEITIGEELCLLDRYMKIQNTRFDNAYDFHVTCPPEAKNYAIIKLLLQPIVENSIAHGFSPEQKSKKIDVKVTLNDNDVVVAIADNGCGMQQEKIKKIFSEANEGQHRLSGIGLANIDQRLRLKYGETYGLQILSDGESGTEVVLHFPCKIPQSALEDPSKNESERGGV